MHSRRDQVQAHLFTLSRITAGLIRAEPDAAETPMRRFSLGTVAGTALGAVALGGLVAFGFISPGVTNSFKKEGTLVLEKETGTRYVFLNGALHPVLNHTSALLISGKPPTQGRRGRFGSGSGIQTVSSKSLKDVPKGPAVGIVGAPDSLPDAARLERGAWSICSATVKAADGTTDKVVTAYLGGAGKGITQLNDQQTMVVTGDDGTAYLAWLDRKLRVDSQSTLTGLGYATVTSFAVKDAWLNSLPSGTDLKGLDVSDRGKNGPSIAGQQSRIGQVFRDPSGASFLLLEDGLSPLTETEAALVLSDPRTQQAYPNAQVLPVDIGTAAVAAAPVSARQLEATGYPAQPPKAVDTGSTGTRVPCYRVEPGTSSEDAKLRVAFRETAPDQVIQPAAGLPRPTAADGAAVADRVAIAPGSGMLVREQAPVSEAAPTIYLITDLGVKYQLSNPDLAQKLGYDVSTAVAMPAEVLDLVPSGPVLDEEAARQPLAANP